MAGRRQGGAAGAAANPAAMLRPVQGIWESHLERALLRKGVGAREAGRRHCSDCGRTPLVGERVHLYSRGAVVCELCRPGHGGEPIRIERIHHSERGHTVRLRPRPA